MYAVEGSTIPTTMSGLFPNLFIDVLLQSIKGIEFNEIKMKMNEFIISDKI